MKPVTIFNFSDVYRRQDFYREIPHEWIDCTDLSGVHGFCDEEALQVIEDRAKEVDGGIRFIDGGNFHYLSYALMKKQQEPYSLVVLDHHTDMIPPRFEGMLSCGSWIRQSLEDQECLQNVIMLGVSDELAGTIEERYQNRVTVYAETDISGEGWLSDFAGQLHEPVYLSIDKDAFSPDELTTDWDQGTMTLKQLHMVWNAINGEAPVLAVDVCGEYNSISGGPLRVEESDKKNSLANGKILNMLLEKRFYA
ncbi:arginase family protein [Clostridium sp. Marseille-P2415]|uniref:arginase family protein n=1 Tax=Clostridium sp. Marseille-P2415 TaxID=1805471 RepID=UPI0009882EF4|nr:arginase family protein [Clostridium sp. Marseille-P2415]